MFGFRQKNLSDASVFLNAVRNAQLSSGKTLRGRARLSSEQRFAIQTISSSNPVIVGLREEISADKKSIDLLDERFEEMCRRQDCVIEKALRPALLERLTLELWLNQKALKTLAARLISATVVQRCDRAGVDV